MPEEDEKPVWDKVPTAKIKASKRFSKYNRDLMTALLKEPYYSIAEAEKILNDFMTAGIPQPVESTEVK